MADKKKMSVEEILAAARNPGSSAAGKPSPVKPSVEAPAETESAAAAQASAETGAGMPEAVPAKAPEKPPGKPGAGGGKVTAASSVADILAAARAAKAGAPAAKSEGKEPMKAAAAPKPSPAPKAAAAPKPAASKPAAPAKDAPKPAAAEKSGGPKDTASILAAVRAASKPGPISKAELAARSQGSAAELVKKKAAPPMPEKPGYALSRPAAVPAPSASRRGFMQTVVAGTFAAFAGSAMALGFSSLAVTFNLWVLGTARFMFPNILTEPPTKFKVGFPDELAQGQVQTKYVPQFGVWIVRYEYDGAPQIYALQTVCTHLGCTPNWLEGEQKFKCPCHGSGFYKDGINFEGPAPRPLERFAIRLADDGQLEVDKSRKFKEELGQWREAASFVPV